MKKKVLLILMLLLLFTLCSCGSATDTYQFLSYEIPSQYSKIEDSETPLYMNNDDYSYTLSVDIKQSEIDILSAEDMLDNRTKSGEFTEVTGVSDVFIADIPAKQYFTYYSDIDSMVLSISFIYNDNLVTLSVSSDNDEIPDNIVDDFEDFINSVSVE